MRFFDLEEALAMETHQDFIDQLPTAEQQKRVHEVLTWIHSSFPNLEPVIKWNQPMFSHEDTYIIGLSTAKGHLSISPEVKALEAFAGAIDQAGYSRAKGIFRIKWDEPVDYTLLEAIIQYNIDDKAGYKKFWR